MTSSSRNPARPAPVAEPDAPRHAALWATLTYALCTLTLAWPALFGGFLVNPRSDQYIGGFPVRDFAGQALKAGQGIPQWNPYLFGGMPYIAAMGVGDIFYPTALLRQLLPVDVAMTWGFVFHVFLAGCFTYGFLRAWGLRFYPALVGGVAYLMSGVVADLVSPGHDGKLFVSALMPLALWMLVRGVRDGRRWAWGGLALAVGLGVLSPHPQLLQYMLLVCGFFGLLLAFGADDEGRKLSRRDAWTRLALATGAVALGFAMGAIQYLPAIEYIPFSPRAGGKGYEYATSFSLPWEELLNTYLPQFSGILSRYWVGTLVVSLLWALGGNTPFYHLVYALVPGSKFFRAPSTMLMVVGMAVAVLAALGTEKLLARQFSRRLIYTWFGVAALFALLATVGVLTSLGQGIASGYAGGQLDDMIAANQGALTLGAWRSLLMVGLAGALLLAWERHRIDVRRLALGLVVLVTLDLWSIDRLYWLWSPRAAVVYAGDAATEYLKTAPPGRVVAEPMSEEGLAFHDPNFHYDGLMVHRIRLVTGYHGNEIGRYRKIVSQDGSEAYRDVLNPVVWRLANVRYLYTNAAIGDTMVKRLVGPVKTAAGSTLYLYRLPGDNPPAWLVPVLVKAPDEAALGTILDPRFDPLRAAVVDSSASVGVSAISALPAAIPVTPAVTRYDPGHIALQLSAPAPAGSALVMSENWFPGWTATVDGKPASTVRTDYTLIGVPLPAGARSIQLDFADPAYPTGRLVTILATLAAAALVAAGALMERRRRAA